MVDVIWSGDAADDSGVAGYSVGWSQEAGSVPDTSVDLAPAVLSTISPPLGSGSFYFHLRTCDNAGNCAGALHLGPFVISAAAPADVNITYIFYDGNVPRVESDEYAQITNEGGSPVNLSGWRLNAGDPGQDFVFPSFVLQPGQTCRVRTNEYHRRAAASASAAVWRCGATAGTAVNLYNASGAQVSQYCY